MSDRQVGCGATVLYTAAEHEFLAGLPDGANGVGLLKWCELEPDHSGLHVTLGQSCPAGEWWLYWNVAGRDGRDLVHRAECRAEADGPDTFGDINLCTLVSGHVGGHSFTFDVGGLPAAERPPILVPRPPDWFRLTRLQRYNHDVLAGRGLTAAAYLMMANLRIEEDHLGIESTRHVGWETNVPVPQLARVDAALLGLPGAVARGYLAPVPRPPYDPLCSSELRVDSIVVRLTPAGRDILTVLEPHLRG